MRVSGQDGALLPAAEVTGMSPRAYVAFAVLCAIWGSTWAAIGVLVQDVPPLRAAMVRFAIAGCLLAVLAFASRSRWPRGVEWRALAWMSATMFALPYGLIFWAEQHVSSGMTAVLYATMPLCTAMLSPWVARDGEAKVIPGRAVQGMIVGLGGVALIVYGAISTSLSQGLGALAVLAAVMLSAGSTIYAKRELKNVSPAAGTSLQFAGAAVWLGVASAAAEHGQSAMWSRQAVEALLFLSVFGSVVAFTLYFWLLKQMEPYKLATLQLVVPVIAVGEGFALLREPLSWTMLGGAGVVLASVVLVLRVRGDEDDLVSLGAAEP